jgi:hypothetical protein
MRRQQQQGGTDDDGQGTHDRHSRHFVDDASVDAGRPEQNKMMKKA